MIHNNLEVIEVFWFSQLDNPNVIGIVKCKDIITNQKKIYMAICDGSNEKKNIKRVLDYGSKISSSFLMELVK